jgi:hypothetical protein
MSTKNPKEQPETTTKGEQSTVDEAVRRAYQDGFKSGFLAGFDSASSLVEAEDDETDEE